MFNVLFFSPRLMASFFDRLMCYETLFSCFLAMILYVYIEYKNILCMLAYDLDTDSISLFMSATMYDLPIFICIYVISLVVSTTGCLFTIYVIISDYVHHIQVKKLFCFLVIIGFVSFYFLFM